MSKGETTMEMSQSEWNQNQMELVVLLLEGGALYSLQNAIRSKKNKASV